MSTFIPTNRPVIGEDLDNLREQLGLSSSEACWLYGLSIMKWMKIVKNGAKDVIRRPSLALLARALDKRPEHSLLPRQPSAQEIFDRIHKVDAEVDKKRLSVLFGSEASAGYRWITKESEISPALARLFMMFQRLFDRAHGQSNRAAIKMLEDWRKMVALEASQRGIANIFTTGRWIAEENSAVGQPIKGEDLDSLREQMGLSTMDACWLFGLSMTNWTIIAKNKGAKIPLKNVTLALLVRVLREYPELCPITPLADAREVYEVIATAQPELDYKRMSIMFGCEASSGYRWLTQGSKIGPVLDRLFKVFMASYAEVKGSPRKLADLVAEWDQMVIEEARARGVVGIYSVGRWSAGDEVADDDGAEGDEGVAPVAKKIRRTNQQPGRVVNASAKAARSTRVSRAIAGVTPEKAFIAAVGKDLSGEEGVLVKRPRGRPRKVVAA